MRLLPVSSLVAVSALAVFAACGAPPVPEVPKAPEAPSASVPAAPSGAPSAAPSASSSAAPAASSAAPAKAELPAEWTEGMSKDQQVAFMKAKVMPKMGPAFQKHDGKRYAEFSCKTCHGPNYKEPKEFLPKLTMKGGKITAFADKPAVSKFMAEVVVPEMASAMGKKPYDPATHQGFGCAGCHTIEQK
jgi:hypothetical protein